MFRFTQDKRSKLQAREFSPQQYRDKIKNSRPLHINQAGAQNIAFQQNKKKAGANNQNAAPPNIPGALNFGAQALNQTTAEPPDFTVAANAGTAINQVNAVAESPESTYLCSLEQVYTPAYIAKDPKSSDVGEKPCFQKPTDNYTKDSKIPDSKTLNPYFAHEKNDFTSFFY